MPPDSPELDDDPEIEFAEIDPTGRYGRVGTFPILNADRSLSALCYFI